MMLFGFLFIPCVAGIAYDQPEQVHLSYGGKIQKYVIQYLLCRPVYFLYKEIIQFCWLQICLNLSCLIITDELWDYIVHLQNVNQSCSFFRTSLNITLSAWHVARRFQSRNRSVSWNKFNFHDSHFVILIAADVSQITVTWSTRNQTNASVVEYGIRGLTQQAVGTSSLFVDGGKKRKEQYIHRVTLLGLQPEEVYCE